MTYLARRSRSNTPLLRELTRAGTWPAHVPAVVLVECLTGEGSRDALVNRLLRSLDVVETIPVALARRAARLRTIARRGSAVDALVVALAEPGGTVVTGDVGDLGALAAVADDVVVVSL